MKLKDAVYVLDSLIGTTKNCDCDEALCYGIDALKREIPKKPKIKGTNDLGEPRIICPKCHCDIDTNWHYCENCGQRLE